VTGATDAQARARSVRRIRNSVLTAAAAAAAVLLTGALRVSDQGVFGAALAAAAVFLVVVMAAIAVDLALVRPAAGPAVRVPPDRAPELHTLVRELAAELGVAAPDDIRLIPDCDSWLEQEGGRSVPRRAPRTVLVVGAPFLWWLRTEELRALLAPVVAGTDPAADPAVAAARRWVRRLDAAALPPAADGHARRRRFGLLGRRLRVTGGLSRAVARQLLDQCRGPAELMERDIAAWAAGHAQPVDTALRATAHEQVGLAYAGWDRLLTRLAAPAWATGRYPDALMDGVVHALTDLSGRDRLAEGFTDRLAKPAASSLLADPTGTDTDVSELAAALFAERREGMEPLRPVSWADYPAAVIEPLWRGRADRLVKLLDYQGGTRDVLLRILAQRRTDPLGISPVEYLAEETVALTAVTAIDAGRVEAAVDWLDGAVLTDREGGRIDVESLVDMVLDEPEETDDGLVGGDAPLLAWLESVGVPVCETVQKGNG
jgi:hypothetical protein